jgi:heme-degrading monooxygenase HmoA
MLVHFLSARLKTNGTNEFARALREEVVPVLRRHKGFRAYDAFVIANGTEAAGISFWDKEEDVEAYLLRSAFQVIWALARVTEGVPLIQTYQISKDTFLAIEELRRGANVIERAPRLQIYAVPRSTFSLIAGSVAASPSSETQTADSSQGT